MKRRAFHLARDRHHASPIKSERYQSKTNKKKIALLLIIFRRIHQKTPSLAREIDSPAASLNGASFKMPHVKRALTKLPFYDSQLLHHKLIFRTVLSRHLRSRYKVPVWVFCQIKRGYLLRARCFYAQSALTMTLMSRLFARSRRVFYNGKSPGKQRTMFSICLRAATWINEAITQ